MKHAAQARKDLGVRGVQPARTAHQPGAPGAADRRGAAARIDGTAGTVALAARVERAWVVHGADGLDELSTTGYTKVSEYRGPGRADVRPSRRFRSRQSHAGGVEGRRRAHQREDCSLRVERRARSRPRRRAFDAGAALFVAGVADTVQDGIAGRSAAAIDSGAALQVFERLIAVSNRTGAQA